MIDIAWIKAQQARATAMPDKRITLPMSEFNELLALAARTVEAEAQRDEMISLVCEHSNSKSFVCIYCVQERQKTIMEDRDRLAKSLEIAEAGMRLARVMCDDVCKCCDIKQRELDRLLAAIASAKGDQP